MITVFGATGNTGSPLVDTLLAKGAAVRAVTSDPAKVAPLSAEDSKAAMIAAGMQEEVAAAMVELASIAPKGYLAGIETTVSDVLGRPARCLRDFVAENRDAFVQ